VTLCDALRRRWLLLSANNLVGTIPESIGNLTALMCEHCRFTLRELARSTSSVVSAPVGARFTSRNVLLAGRCV
jgi:hypothetical protein